MGAAHDTRAQIMRALSTTQEAMLATHLLGTGNGIHLQQLIVDLHEAVDVPRLQCLWNEKMAQHPILRTAFSWSGTGEPVQWVASTVTIPWAVHDLAALPPAEQTIRWQALLAEDRARGFDLGAPPLLRFLLARLGPEHWRLAWSYHHILIDGRSQVLVLAEVLRDYDTKRTTASPVAQDVFGDFIAWQAAWKRTRLPEAEAFWRARLDGLAPAPPLPWEKPADPVTPLEMRTLARSFPADATCRLRSAADALGVTVNTFLQGAWALTLGLYTGTDDVVFGAVRSGRHGHVPGAEDAPGLFITTLPVRVRLPPGQTTARWLADLRTQHIAMRPFEHTPSGRLRGWLRWPGSVPLFTSLLVCENYRLEKELCRHSEDPSGARRFELLERSDFPLILSAEIDEELSLQLTGDTRRFAPALLEDLLTRVVHFLDVFVTSSQLRLSELPLLTPREYQLIVNDWNATWRPAPAMARLHAGFEKQAACQPAHACLVDGDITWTYGEVELRASQVAGYLRRRGIAANDLVAVHLEKSPVLLAVILGVLKAGAAYLPIDPAIASGRARRMLTHSGARLLVTESTLIETGNLSDLPVLRLAESWPEILREEPAPRLPDDETAPQNLAYAIFTSGSTGDSKLIGVEHAQAANLIDYATRELFDADDLRVVPFIDSISFDSCVQQIFATLTLGGTLVLQRDLTALLRSVWADRFTSLGTTPSALAALLDADALPKSIRVLGLGGEAIPPTLIDRIRQLTHLRKVLNYYGPTETTIYSTVAWILDRRRPESRADSISLGAPGRLLGRPIQNTRIYVLDDALRPVPPGVTGEIHIGGAGVTRGYLAVPALTAECFSTDPCNGGPGARRYRTGDLGRFLPDGTLEFIGRVDSQFKLRGLRLEPEEIEAHIAACEGVRQTVVALHEIQPGKPRLVAYVVAAETVTLASLHAFMKPRVPGFMLPALLVKLDRLPLTTNGKVDRRALPAPLAPFDASAANSTPTSTTEPPAPADAALAQIWSELLGIDQVGQHDNFFVLGGDSLLAVRLMMEIEKRFGRQLPASALAQAPTLAGLTRLLTEADASSAALGTLVPLQPLGDARPVFCLPGWGGDVQVYTHFAQALAPDHPVYGLRATTFNDCQPHPVDVEEMASLYAGHIRARQPNGPYILVGHSLGGWVAYAVAQELMRQGEQIALLALLDTGANEGLPLPLHLINNIPHLAKRAVFHCRRIITMSRDERVAYLRLRLRWFWFHARRDPRKIAPEFNSDEFLPKNDRYAPSILRYRPAAYRGDLTLFATPQTEASALWFWRGLVRGQTHVYRVPGKHMTIIDRNHASDFARVFVSVLKKADSPCSSV